MCIFHSTSISKAHQLDREEWIESRLIGTKYGSSTANLTFKETSFSIKSKFLIFKIIYSPDIHYLHNFEWKAAATTSKSDSFADKLAKIIPSVPKRVAEAASSYGASLKRIGTVCSESIGEHKILRIQISSCNHLDDIREMCGHIIGFQILFLSRTSMAHLSNIPRSDCVARIVVIMRKISTPSV